VGERPGAAAAERPAAGVQPAAVPENIKEAINVESGLNDAIALPPILACMAVLSSTAAEKPSVQYWIVFTLQQLLFGPLLGLLAGWLSIGLIGWFGPRGIASVLYLLMVGNELGPAE
jgi:sodium/hydrogen antiporter